MLIVETFPDGPLTRFSHFHIHVQSWGEEGGGRHHKVMYTKHTGTRKKYKSRM